MTKEEIELADGLTKILKNELNQYCEIVYQCDDEDWDPDNSEDNLRFLRAKSDRGYVDIGIHTNKSTSVRGEVGIYYGHRRNYNFLPLVDPNFVEKITKYIISKLR